MNPVKTPNLKAFTEELPKTRIGILRMLWPTIQTCLDAGHSLRDVHEKLHLDGIEMAYSTLCWAVAALRQSAPSTVDRRPKITADLTAPRRAGETRSEQEKFDPLRNLRQLTENRPGFEYTGTLPDEELFGRK
jgi:hypothetical protein